MVKSDLPFGSEFSPSQIDLIRVLEIAEKHSGDWRALEDAIRQEYFDSHPTNEYNRRKLANNCKLGMNRLNDKPKAPRNRTITLSSNEVDFYQRNLLKLSRQVELHEIENRTINQDLFEVLDWLPDSFVDLLFIDPPYNLTKSFNATTFKERSIEEYKEWFESWFPKLLRTLKKTASVYICADWRSSTAIHTVAEKYLIVRNRIAWEREKGRGAKANWKNCSEDIWFGTVSNDYVFNLDAVKLKRRVIAPYTDLEGKPKDWEKTENGGYRLTHPSNIWTDLTVPFWSMPENTDHPTQKPEKLLAKIVLASSNPGDLVFDPFLGSGTTSVVAKKLGRRYVGIERDLTYCCLAEKRLATAESDRSIQGHVDGVFWERNSSQDRKRHQGTKKSKALETTVVNRIFPKIEALAKAPRPVGCRKLRCERNLWRIRIGDYRVIYAVYDDKRIVDIIAVRHRSKAYE